MPSWSWPGTVHNVSYVPAARAGTSSVVDPSTSMLGVSIVSPSDDDAERVRRLTVVHHVERDVAARGHLDRGRFDREVGQHHVDGDGTGGGRRLAVAGGRGLLTVAAAGDGDEREHRRQCQRSHAEPSHHRSPSGTGVRAYMREESAGTVGPMGVPGDPTRRGTCVPASRPPMPRHWVACSLATSWNSRWTPSGSRTRCCAIRIRGCPGWPARRTTTVTRLLAEVGFGDDVRVARRVAIELGEPVKMPSKTVVPIRWSAAGARRPVPVARRRSRDRAARPAPVAAGDERTIRAAPRGRRPRDRSRGPVPRRRGDPQGLPRSGEGLAARRAGGRPPARLTRR